MKRTVFTILTVTLVFLGAGALVERTTAKFKSDEKALELVRKARQAIGGDTAIASVKSLRISGHTTKTFKSDGGIKTEGGDTTMSFTLGGSLMRSDNFGGGDGEPKTRTEMRSESRTVTLAAPGQSEMKVRLGEGRGEGAGSGTGVSSEVHLIIKKDDGTTQELTGAEAEKFIQEHQGEMTGEHRVFIKKDDGTVDVTVSNGDEKVGDKTANGVVLRKMDHGGNATFETKDGKTIVTDGNVLMRHPGPEGGAVFMRHPGPEMPQKNGLLRLTLGLLMSQPEGSNVEYTYGGEGDVDGTACSIVIASTEGQSYKIFLSKSSDLPVALGYSGPAIEFATFTNRVAGPGESKDGAVTTFNMKVPAPADGQERTMTFKTRVDGTTDPQGNVMFKRAGGDSVDYLVKFSDYRTVNGVQLPYKWTTTVGGNADETFDVTTYDVNPANVSLKVAPAAPIKVRSATDH